jgi:hypothetical protein
MRRCNSTSTASCSREAAKISTFNHGLRHGDGVFERIRIYNRRIRLDTTTMRPTRETIASDHAAIRQGSAAQPAPLPSTSKEETPMNTIDTGGRR